MKLNIMFPRLKRWQEISIAILIGFFVLLHLRNKGLFFSGVNSSSGINRYEKAELLDTNPVSDDEEQAPTKRKCLIGIASDRKTLSTLGLTLLNSWVKDIKLTCTVKYFIGHDTATPLDSELVDTFGDTLVELDVSDEYPPIKKVFGIWSYFYENHALEYDWFAKVDSDSYINPVLFEKLLSKESLSVPLYMGSGKQGRTAEKKILGLEAEYCLGLGYVMNSILLKSLGPNLSNCLNSKMSVHSDTEIGRCVYKSAGIGCKDSGSFHQYYSSVDKKGSIHPRTLDKNAQMVARFSPYPNNRVMDYAIIHPLKDSKEINRLNHQVRHKLRPSLSIPFVEKNMLKIVKDVTYKQELKAFENSCVNNPSIQLNLQGRYLPECPAINPDTEPHLDMPAFVLSMSGEKNEKHFDALSKHMKEEVGFKNVFRFLGVNGNEKYSPENKKFLKQDDRVHHLKNGELGYRDSMEEVLMLAMKLKLPRIAVFDDDVYFHCNFKEKFYEAMKEQRCGGYSWSNKSGGVVLLGSTHWVNGKYPVFNEQHYGGWYIADADMANATKAGRKDGTLQKGEKTHCFNANAKSFGSHAVIYHESVYSDILRWLREEKIEPFDWVFRWLGREGHITRTIYPFLAIQYLDHESSVDNQRTDQNNWKARYKTHRWDQQPYCLPGEDREEVIKNFKKTKSRARAKKK